MKKILLFIVFLSAFIIAQEDGALIGRGIVFVDSLKNYSATYDSDSSKVYDFRLGYGFFSILISDSGTTYTDSVKLFKGAIRYTNSFSHDPVDTVWSSEALPVKNNGWNVDTVLVGAGKNKFYTVLENNIQLLKVLNVNAQIVAGRKTDIVIEARKEN